LGEKELSKGRGKSELGDLDENFGGSKKRYLVLLDGSDHR